MSHRSLSKISDNWSTRPLTPILLIKFTSVDPLWCTIRSLLHSRKRESLLIRSSTFEEDYLQPITEKCGLIVWLYKSILAGSHNEAKFNFLLSPFCPSGKSIHMYCPCYFYWLSTNNITRMFEFICIGISFVFPIHPHNILHWTWQ